MTIDRSLKVKAGSVKNRNVITRAERMAQMIEKGDWKEDSTIFGMPKTRVVKISLKKKKKDKAKDEEDAK